MVVTSHLFWAHWMTTGLPDLAFRLVLENYCCGLSLIMKFPEIIVHHLKEHDPIYLPIGSAYNMGMVFSFDKAPYLQPLL